MSVALVLSTVSADSGATDLLQYDYFPHENNLLLDGMPTSGVGSFAVPHRPTLLNPASLATVPQAQGAFDFQRFYWGIGEVISSGNILYVHRQMNRGWGATAGIFSGGLLSTQSFAVHYAQRIGKPTSYIDETRRLGLFGGTTARIRRRVYSESRFRLADTNDPLFTSGSSAIALSFGAGMIYRKPEWAISLAVDDINRPDLGIAEEDRLPLELQIAGEFTLPWEGIRITPSLNYRSEYGEFESNFDPNIAIRRDFLNGNLELGVFAGRWAIGIGATYYLDAEGGPGIRYEASQPLTGLNIPSHRVSASYRFEPPPPAYPDLVVKSIRMDSDPITEQPIKIIIEVDNRGIRVANDFKVAVFSEGELIHSLDIPKIPSGRSAEVDFEWTAHDSGTFEFLVRADDAGDLYPNFNGKILELNETNNELSSSFYIYGLPSIRLSVDVKELHATQRITVTEDEPMIPIVFFDAGSDLLLDRFSAMLKNIAQRMHENPEAVLSLEGYFSGDDLQNADGRVIADARASNVKNAILSIDPSLEGRIDISRWHDRSHSRAERERFEGTRLGARYTAEENRRVELRISPAQPYEWHLKAYPLERLDLAKFKDRLSKNPLFEIVAVAPTLDSAYTVERNLAKLIGPKFAERVYSRAAKNEEAKVLITAGGILYKPQAFEVPEGGLAIEPGYDRSSIDLSVAGGGDVSESRISIENSDGKLIREFKEKRGLAKNAEWNWKDTGGNIVDPNDLYIVQAELIDKFGQTALAPPETLRVNLTNLKDFSGRLILVQFVFAGAHGEPDYASVRMEQLAREIVDRIERDGGVDVLIGGHTDVVGVETANQSLSLRRAEEQFATFKEYMMKILQMADEAELEEWLTSKNSLLSVRGYGSSRPYVLTRGTGSDFYQIELGDNTLPEGRITNRRVEIEFTPKRE